MNFFILATVFVSELAIGVNPADYPKIDTIAPPNQAWSDAFLKVQIPKIAFRIGITIGPEGNEDVKKCADAKDWGLTYDDGSSKFTPTVLKELAAVNAKATFFIVGSRIAESAASAANLKAAHDAGHQIAIHTWSHNSLPTLTNEQIVAEIGYTIKIVKEVIGVAPSFIRAPYGEIDERVRAIVKAMGLTHVYWTRDSNDWKVADFKAGDEAAVTSSQAIVDTFSSWKEEGGHISLQHDIYEATVAIVRPTLAAIVGAKFNFKTVAECSGMGLGAYSDFAINLMNGGAATPTQPIITIAGPSPTDTVKPTGPTPVTQTLTATTGTATASSTSNNSAFGSTASMMLVTASLFLML
jgi:peptidoglycan/xylan/chitin deacetylase (PgdA/CDA1 family)